MASTDAQRVQALRKALEEIRDYDHGKFFLGGMSEGAWISSYDNLKKIAATALAVDEPASE